MRVQVRVRIRPDDARACVHASVYVVCVHAASASFRRLFSVVSDILGFGVSLSGKELDRWRMTGRGPLKNEVMGRRDTDI